MSDEPDAMANCDLARVRAVVDGLAEHFDSIQVFCTRHESGTLDGTVRVAMGAGNWYARYGQIHQWMTAQDEAARIGERTETDE